MRRKWLLLAFGVTVLLSYSSAGHAGRAKELMKDGAPGAWCRIRYGIPYYFENVGSGSLTVTYDSARKKYSVKGTAKLLPFGKIKKDEKFGLPEDEGSIARAIDAAGKVDWGSLPKKEVARAEKALAFCRCVARYEAGKPLTDCKVLKGGNMKVIDGEPARLMFSTDGSMKGSWGAVGTDLRFKYVGPGSVKFYQLKPSGRFRVSGTVKVVKTGQICKNGWIGKDGKVTYTEE